MGDKVVNWLGTTNLNILRRRSPVGQLVLLCLSVELIFFASFSSVQLPTATGGNISNFSQFAAQQTVALMPPRFQEKVLAVCPRLAEPAGEVRYSPYVPLAPLAVLLGYAMGIPLGFVACAVFILTGLIADLTGILPFAGGGGVDYYAQPTFGYLIGLTLAAWFAGRITLSGNAFWRRLAAIAGGLAIVHVSGLVYLFGRYVLIMLFEGERAAAVWQPWVFEQVRNLSGYALPYDIFFTLALIGIGSPIRWLADTLTSPDIALRPKATWKHKFEEVL
jgi:biotin transporter BioY